MLVMPAASPRAGVTRSVPTARVAEPGAVGSSFAPPTAVRATVGVMSAFTAPAPPPVAAGGAATTPTGTLAPPPPPPPPGPPAAVAAPAVMRAAPVTPTMNQDLIELGSRAGIDTPFVLVAISVRATNQLAGGTIRDRPSTNLSTGSPRS